MNTLTLMLAILAGTVPGATNAPGAFIIADDGTSQVSFEVEAAFHRVVGTSKSPEGRFAVAIEAPNAVTGWVRVPVASLTTGSPERDEALRKPGLLDAESHPTIEFRIASAEFPDGSRIAPDRDIEGTAKGTLTLKGKRRPMSVPIKVGWQEGTQENPAPRLHVQTRFLVKLSEFGIGSKLPGILVSDEAAVAADLYATRR